MKRLIYAWGLLLMFQACQQKTANANDTEVPSDGNDSVPNVLLMEEDEDDIV